MSNPERRVLMSLRSSSGGMIRRPTPRKSPPARPLALERLEDRCLLSYSITDLGTFGGPSSLAYNINSAGPVVGYAQSARGVSDAFLWQNGKMTDVKTLGGRLSFATAVSDAGVVTGYAQTSAMLMHAFLWRPDQVIKDLGTLPT